MATRLRAAGFRGEVLAVVRGAALTAGVALEGRRVAGEMAAPASRARGMGPASESIGALERD